MLVVNQINGSYEAKHLHIKKYLEKVKILEKQFQNLKITQVLRTKNKQANALRKLASVAFEHLSKEVLVEVLPKRTIEREEMETFDTSEEQSWMTPFLIFIKDGKLPDNENEARKIRINSPQYTIINNRLYRRGYSTPWMKCLCKTEGESVILEMHQGECGAHAGGRAIAQKILRMGYFWPTLMADTEDLIKRCKS